jgi:hypothetical protein
VRPKIFSPTWASSEVVSTKEGGAGGGFPALGRPEVDSVSKNVLENLGANRQKPPKMCANQGPPNEGPDSEAHTYTYSHSPTHAVLHTNTAVTHVPSSMESFGSVDFLSPGQRLRGQLAGETFFIGTRSKEAQSARFPRVAALVKLRPPKPPPRPASPGSPNTIFLQLAGTNTAYLPSWGGWGDTPTPVSWSEAM